LHTLCMILRGRFVSDWEQPTRDNNACFIFAPRLIRTTGTICIIE